MQGLKTNFVWDAFLQVTVALKQYLNVKCDTKVEIAA